MPLAGLTVLVTILQRIYSLLLHALNQKPLFAKTFQSRAISFAVKKCNGKMYFLFRRDNSVTRKDICERGTWLIKSSKIIQKSSSCLSINHFRFLRV